MYLTSVHVHGLRGAEDFSASRLERVVDLPSGPPGLAVADALSIFSGSLDAASLPRALVTLGVAGSPGEVSILEEDGFPTQVTLADARGVAPLLPPDGSRQITVQVDVELDPPLFGRLRGLAVRDPRLVTALGEGARLSVKVGWLFTNDLETVSIGLLGVAVGDTPFPSTGTERPAWLGPLLRDIGGRFGRVTGYETPDLVAERLLESALSRDPERRSRYARVAEAVAEAPFGLGRLELVRAAGTVEPCFGPKLLRSRQFGPASLEALRLAEAVLLEAPDVLIVEAPGIAQTDPRAVRGWLERHASGDRATLEQVIIAQAGSGEPPGGVA